MHTHTHAYIHTHAYAHAPTHTHRQLYMFSQLMQQSPEIMLQLGISPETLQVEIRKLETIDKLQVTPPTCRSEEFTNEFFHCSTQVQKRREKKTVSSGFHGWGVTGTYKCGSRINQSAYCSR